MFKLNPVVEEKFNAYLKKAKPEPSTPLICVQVRIGETSDMDFTMRNFSVHYWDFIRKNFINNLKDYRVFVTSDTESVEKEAIEEFGREKTVVIDGVSTHFDSESDKREDCSRFEKIIMDFWMLGNCDMALVSDSGFGIFGILRNRVPEQDFYVLSALLSDYQRSEIFPLKHFIHEYPYRY